MFLGFYCDLFLIYCIYVNYKNIVNFCFNLYVFFTRYMFIPVGSKSKPFPSKRGLFFKKLLNFDQQLY